MIFPYICSPLQKNIEIMWQRIQTLYLAISTILMAVMLFSVKATVPGADGTTIETLKFAYLNHHI